MKLRCTGNYINGPRNLVYRKGEVFDASPDLRAFLLADAPGCFEELEEPSETAEKGLDAPPMDKAIKSPPKKKRK